MSLDDYWWLFFIQNTVQNFENDGFLEVEAFASFRNDVLFVLAWVMLVVFLRVWRE